MKHAAVLCMQRAQVARAQLNIMLIVSARPLEEYFETIPQEFISLREMGSTVEMRPLTADECLELTRVIIGDELLAQHPEVHACSDRLRRLCDDLTLLTGLIVHVVVCCSRCKEV